MRTTALHFFVLLLAVVGCTNGELLFDDRPNQNPTTVWAPVSFRVLGQPNVTTNTGLISGFNGPIGAFALSGIYLVADTGNNRVLLWKTTPTAGTPPTVVLGQPTLSTNTPNFGGISASGLNHPMGVAAMAARIAVADTYNHRVLVWNSLPSTNNQPADMVIGQSSFSTGTVQTVGASSLNSPQDVSFEPVSGGFAVADTGNNRILVWDSLTSSGSGAPPNRVVGQPDFVSSGTGTSTTTLNQPTGVFLRNSGSVALYVADSANNRALYYPSLSSANSSAGAVWGQADFVTGTANSGGISATSLSAPLKIAVSSSQMIVTDNGNSRTLVWNTTLPFSSAGANLALGQTDFATSTQNSGSVVLGGQLNGPAGIFALGGKFGLLDASNNRAMLWNTLPTTNGASSDLILGQPDTSSHRQNAVATAATNLYQPGAVYSDGTRLFIADTGNHRVLIWNRLPTSDNQAPDLVLGQSSFNSSIPNNGGLSARGLNSPSSVTSARGRLFVSDRDNNRILVWNSIPTSNYQAADLVLGQPDFSSSSPSVLSGFTSPRGIATDGTRLYLADSGNNRVLIWNALPGTTGQNPDVVVGQNDFTSIGANQGGPPTLATLNTPVGVASDGQRLLVCDELNHRVLVWDAIPNSSGSAASFVLGQASPSGNLPNNGGSTPTASTLNTPQGVWTDGTQVFVADSLNHRVLRWTTMPSATDAAADYVYGQSNFSASQANSNGLTGDTLNTPLGVFGVGLSVLIADSENYRVIASPRPQP